MRYPVLQQVGQYVRLSEVIDCNYVYSFHIVYLSEGKAADTAKPIDGNFYCTHFFKLKNVFFKCGAKVGKFKI